jgi:tetratricopeptide (TPR) repeat protein
MKPDHYQAYLNLAQVYRQQKNWPAAAEQLGLAFKRAPQLSALYRARAQLAVDQGDTQAAQSYFRQAIQRETASAVARADDHVEIGRLLQQNHGYAEALQAYDAALQERPKHGDALRGRARMLLELKRYKEAIDSFNRSLEVGPASADLYQLRGLARSQIREYRAALDDYSQALQLEPTATRYVRRGWLYLLSDAFELARQDFDQAIGLDVANGDAHAGRGLALVQLGRTKDAITDAREAVRLGPQTPPFLCKVAGIYSQALARLDGTPGGRNADLRLDYQQEAVRLISRALDRLSPDERPLFWKQTIHPDKALGPLRQLSKEFRDLENAQAFKLPH